MYVNQRIKGVIAISMIWLISLLIIFAITGIPKKINISAFVVLVFYIFTVIVVYFSNDENEKKENIPNLEIKKDENNERLNNLKKSYATKTYNVMKILFAISLVIFIFNFKYGLLLFLISGIYLSFYQIYEIIITNKFSFKMNKFNTYDKSMLSVKFPLLIMMTLGMIFFLIMFIINFKVIPS